MHLERRGLKLLSPVLHRPFLDVACSVNMHVLAGLLSRDGWPQRPALGWAEDQGGPVRNSPEGFATNA